MTSRCIAGTWRATRPHDGEAVAGVGAGEAVGRGFQHLFAQRGPAWRDRGSLRPSPRCRWQSVRTLDGAGQAGREAICPSPGRPLAPCAAAVRAWPSRSPQRPRARRLAGRPAGQVGRRQAARSRAATIDPADVPTSRSAWRASQPSSWCRAASTPAWKAWPTVPPAPSTTATRVGGHRPIVAGGGGPRAAGPRRRSRPPVREDGGTRGGPADGDQARDGDIGASGSECLRVAIVAYQGVLADESWAFRDVFARVPGRPRADRRASPRRRRRSRRRAADRGHVRRASGTADVVVVPGGLGSHRHPEISAWLRRVEPRWVLTSSTGSALLAASGLLRGRTAATHWLAGPLLERHGVVVSRRPPGRRPPVRHVRRPGQRPTTRRSSSSAPSAGPISCATSASSWPRPASPARRVVTPTPAPSPPRPASRPTAVVEVELEETTPHAVGDTGHDRAGTARRSWHHRRHGFVVDTGRAVGEQRRPRRRRDGPHPPDPARRRAGAGGLPRAAVAREHLPALLLAPPAAERRRPRALHDRRHGRPRRPRRRALRRVHRLGQLRALGRPRRRRRRVHGRRRAPRQGHRHAAPRAPRGDRPRQRRSPASPPRCSPTTGRCWPCSAAPGGRSSGASRAGSSTSTSPSTRPRSSSTRSSGASSGPTPGPSPASCSRARSPSSAPATRRARSARRSGATSRPAPPAPCSPSTRATTRSVDGRAWPTLQRRSRPTCRSPSSPSRPPRCRRSIDDCIESHVRGAVIVTSVEGTDIDVAALVERARSYGVRLIGPGSMGIASSRPSIGLQASLVPVTLPPGNVADLAAVRLARRLACCGSPTSCAWACRGSSRSATRATCPATTCCSSGRTTRRRGSSPCTPSRSATRASSPASPGACRSTGRSSPCARVPRRSARRAGRCTSTPD